MNEKEKEILTKTINNVSFPEHWVEEGAVEANKIAKENAIKVCEILYEYVKLPSIIASSVESGIYLLFNIDNRYDLSIESCNNRQIVSLINDKKLNKTVIVEDIIQLDFHLIIEYINKLKEEV